MKTGRITAKLRDAVPVCLMAEGKEVKRYKNIELPDSIKEVELLDFHFNVPADGKITFEISYAQGVLPEVFPEPRAKVTRAEKAAAKAQKKVGFGKMSCKTMFYIREIFMQQFSYLFFM